MSRIFVTLKLRTRIYISMLAILLISFLVTGGIAIYDHFEQNERFNQLRFERKEKAIRASFDYFLNQEGGFIKPDSVALAFSDKVCELSDVHSLFIALYDLRGNYLISANSQTLDSLHIPYKINYTILKQLSSGSDRAVIDKSISTEQFTLAYWYFKDLAGKPIAITNVGYQSRDDESAGLMDFLSELMQSYILLFLLASLAAYLLSTYITRSLQTIQERLQNVQFGQRNDPILWESQDEIGSLVNEYNRMLGELEISANKLAQQERESAWREMAKQVAHEIKNPLTPMKLRVQHLERTRNDDPTHFDDKLKQFCVSMTEQIDTLTRIADEFSLFAKMPKPVLEKVDLFDLAQDVINLYLDNGRAEITFRPFPECAHYVLADKNHVIRALNNLIMNAIQAFPERTSGKIEVAIRPCGTSLFVRVSDNGPGIPAEQFRSIFSPNFTTKSTGTGLGLSMVKNMIESAGGKVWFRSRINRGASFYFSLPVWKS